MLNAIGLQNVGIDAFIKHKMPFLRTVNTPVIANFFGNTLEEYGEVARRLNDIPEIAAAELNISCPNVKQGGIVFGTDPRAASEVVTLVRKQLQKPLIVKLTPNVTDITVVARAVEEAGADAIACINTLTGMSVDVHTRKPRLANRTGGLSGPAIRPIAVRMVHQVVQTVSVPVIGIGGIVRADGCPRVPDRRRQGGPGRYGQFRRPDRHAVDHRGDRGVLHRRGDRRYSPADRQP